MCTVEGLGDTWNPCHLQVSAFYYVLSYYPVCLKSYCAIYFSTHRTGVCGGAISRAPPRLLIVSVLLIQTEESLEGSRPHTYREDSQLTAPSVAHGPHSTKSVQYTPAHTAHTQSHTHSHMYTHMHAHVRTGMPMIKMSHILSPSACCQKQPV